LGSAFGPAASPETIRPSTPALWKLSVRAIVDEEDALAVADQHVRHVDPLHAPTVQRLRMKLAVTRDDVEGAREAIGGRLHRTPTFTSRTLSERVAGSAYLKAELFQRTGSFKPRGVLNNLASLSSDQRERGVIGISAGNHAQALAYCAALEGLACRVIMWRGASEQKLEAARGYGAEVDTSAANATEAFERLQEVIDETGMTPVHPFDDPRTIAGQGTVGLELAEDVPHADVVVVPVGGGGLVSGIAAAVDARVVAVEPERSPALHAALAAGEPVPVPTDTVADGLAAPFAGAHCVAVCRGRVETVLVSEEELEDGMRFLYARAKLACEPAGAAAVAALLAGKVGLRARTTVVAVVSGGNVASKTASAILGRE
jgi:threonine dehydratase